MFVELPRPILNKYFTLGLVQADFVYFYKYDSANQFGFNFNTYSEKAPPKSDYDTSITLKYQQS